VLVGPGARILAGALIVGPTSIGADALIEGGATVSRSSIWRRSTVSEGATVDRSLVGDDAFIEPGAHLFRGVVVDSTSRQLRPELEWGTRSSSKPPRRSTLDMGARISRLVFGAGWSRSPAAQ
jgi:mannose-1-phosphate guanylyltransferase